MSEYLCTNSEVYDCAVIGLGGHGSATVAQLAQRGSKVIGIEKFYRCHDQGSSHGRSRVYRQAYFEHPMYVPLLQRSLELWLELEQFAKERASSTSSKPIKLINLCGGLMMGQPGSAVIQGTLDSIKEHNLPHEYLTSDQLRSRYPSFHVKDSEVGVFEKNAGYLNPEACIDAYLQLAELHGATLYFNESMISWNRDPLRSTITVTTDKGSFLTNKLVLTVGAWAKEIYGSQLPFPLHLERRVLYWFEPLPHVRAMTSGETKGNSSTADDLQNIPIYLSDLSSRETFYGFPDQNEIPGEGVKVAMHNLLDASSTVFSSPETMNRVVTTEEVEAIRSIIKDRIPILDGKLIKSVSCMYTMTPDEHFLIDFMPNTNSSVVLASPCSGHGFKFCSGIGEVLADLVIEGKSKENIALFSIYNRIK